MSISILLYGQLLQVIGYIETRTDIKYDEKEDVVNMRVIVSMLTTLDGGKTYTCNNVNECKLGESADYLYNE